LLLEGVRVTRGGAQGGVLHALGIAKPISSATAQPLGPARPHKRRGSHIVRLVICPSVKCFHARSLPAGQPNRVHWAPKCHASRAGRRAGAAGALLPLSAGAVDRNPLSAVAVQWYWAVVCMRVLTHQHSWVIGELGTAAPRQLRGAPTWAGTPPPSSRHASATAHSVLHSRRMSHSPC
jgi:hypothetical protein